MTFNDLLQRMIERQASDLHLIAGLHPALRLHGELVPLEEVPKFTPESLKDLLFAALTPHQQNIFQNDPLNRNELDFGYGIPGLGRFRVNVHTSRGGVAASVRALAGRIPSLEELGLPPSAAEFTRAKRGLVLVTGPTGSGKSTTLAALIDAINRTRRDHILTIEDPIEYTHNSKMSYVTQREVGASGDTLSFRNALKYALRQDPDVILIGEMRDYETIGIAITSAETGHLVFGTLHTSSAAQTVSRIVDVFPTDQQPQVRTQLASTLLGVISQVLLPRTDGAGRVAACEILMANSAVRNNIRSGKVDAIYQTLQTASCEGMRTMDQSLVKLCREGVIDYEAAKPYIYERTTHETIKALRRS
ncbi:MAG: type IV pilus twitching motility protein PilT [Candidatus Aminicenantes bacterium]|nr:type IV pilus twitching motility protein PilT [Candidatus Aminicenantes bacterium]